jgi:hypothetical protein
MRAVTLVVVFVLGLFIGALVFGAKKPIPSEEISPLEGQVAPEQAAVAGSSHSDPAVYSDESHQDWLRSLQQGLSTETAERLRLEDQLDALQLQVDRLELLLNQGQVPTQEARRSQTPHALEAPTENRGAVGDLVAAGFDAGRAADIARQLEQDQMQRLFLRDRATREEWINTPRYVEELQSLSDSRDTLRAEMSETEYEKLLFATGQPNRVVVAGVIETSPAQQVGIQAGDTLYRYAGKRVYSTSELREATTEGQIGESVLLELLREGQLLEFTLSRGPLGVRIDSVSIDPDG